MMSSPITNFTYLSRRLFGNNKSIKVAINTKRTICFNQSLIQETICFTYLIMAEMFPAATKMVTERKNMSPTVAKAAKT